MGRDVAEACPEARQVFEEADEALGFSLSRLCFEGPEDELLLTENTQPAILATSVALLRAWRSRAEPPAWVAGHSLGEYTALVAAGCLTLGDAVRLVRLRGRLMQRAVPVGVGAMAAVIGLDPDRVERICAEQARGEVLSPANFNSPEQTVIAGHAAAVARASEAASAAGAKRVLPLPVSAPFHCDLMKPAEQGLAEELGNVRFGELAVPLVNNVDAALVRRPEEARRGLVRQVCAAVRWTDCVRTLAEAGARTFVEIGPGRVLAGLVRRIDRSLETLGVGTLQQVREHV